MARSKTKRGITLVALIITVVVLLILAIVSIRLVMNGGVINKAKYGVDKYSEEEAKEQIQMAILESYNDNGKLDKTKLVENLEKIGASVEGTDFPFLVTLNKYNFTIYDDGETNKVSDNAISSSKINGIVSNTNMSSEQKRDFYRGLYGKTVNYPVKITTKFTSSNGEGKGKWRIFYADEYNIYLISDSSIKLPHSSEDTSQNSFLSGYVTLTQWSGLFGTNSSYNDGIFPNYPTTNLNYNRTSPTNITKYADESTLKKLNSSYYSLEAPPNSNSLRAVISMLDTDVWSVYRDTRYAQYSIGGPSLEMVCKSYSQTHENGVEAKAFAKQNGVADQYGYKVRKIGEEEYKFGTDNWAISSDLDNLYVKQDNPYWFCSSCAQTSYARIFYMGNYGGLNANYAHDVNNTSYMTGFRPIVCLKSNVQLEKSTNSEYDYELK